MASSQGEAAVAEIEVTPSPPEGKRPRRCVQSKLPWGLPRVDEFEGASDAIGPPEVEDGEDEGDGSDEESGEKRRKKRVSKPRARKKSPCPRKKAPVATRGKKTLVASPGKNGTPKKECDLHGADIKSLSPGPRLPDNTGTLKNAGDESKVCNLRLEAKAAAEENLRLSAGKQIHPFFASRKSAKRVIEIQDDGIVESKECFDLGQDDYISFPPFHVACCQDAGTPLNWNKWEFMENPFSETCYSFQKILLDTVDSSGLLYSKQVWQLEESADAKNLTTCSSVSVDVQGQKEQLFTDPKVFNNQSSLSSMCGSDGDIETTQRDKHSDQQIHCRRSQSILWTDKYHPESASEVCGNWDSVKLLNEWLRTWQEDDKSNTNKHKFGKKKHTVEDSDDSLYQDDSDMDESEYSSNHKNVLLITGPIGSGKSAAIYACAKEQGFEVIEVNTSDTRNGAYLKLKFGDSMESHGLNHWTAGKTKDETIDNNGPVANLIQNDESDILNGSKKDKFPAGCPWNVTKERSSTNQAATKTLILFEDVDTVFEEDSGFISSIMQLAENTKRPIILTSNREDPKLPTLLERLIVDFKYPSAAELLSHVQMICASEEYQISDKLLKQLIRSSLGDIRKTLMLLQFWCQGENEYKGGCLRYRYAPIEFDIDTVHLALPRIFSWEFHCALSEKVAEEVNKTISLMEESFKQLEVSDALTAGNIVERKKRKKTKLKKNNSILDSEISSQANDLDDFFHASESPVASNRQKRKRRPFLIMSSQSDDGSGEELPPTEFTSFLLPRTSPGTSTVPSSLLESESPLESPIKRKCWSWTDDIQQAASVSHICDTMLLQEESCVPESLLVSESELSKRDDVLAVPLASNWIIASSSDIMESISVSKEANNSTEILIDLNTCPMNNNEAHVELFYGEELGDSQVVVEPQTGEYNLLDECSRADFRSWFAPKKDDKCSKDTVSVQDTWERMRSQREEMKACLNNKSEGTSLMLKITSQVTELISETDIMVNKCYPFITGMPEASLTPVVEPDAFSWYNDQFHIGSTYAQHGLSVSLDECRRVCSNWGLERTESLAEEMLACSTNSMAFGRLLNIKSDSTENIDDKIEHEKDMKHGIPVKRIPQADVLEALLSLVPPRLSMTLRGPAFQDYLSFTSKISKFECRRLSESMSEISRPRSRTPRHYLASGARPLSSEDAVLLAQCNCYTDSTPTSQA